MINYWNVIQRTHREKDNQKLLKYLAKEFRENTLNLLRKIFQQNNR